MLSHGQVLVDLEGDAAQGDDEFGAATQLGGGVELPVLGEDAGEVALEHEGEQQPLSGQDDAGPLVEVEALLQHRLGHVEWVVPLLSLQTQHNTTHLHLQRGSTV